MRVCSCIWLRIFMRINWNRIEMESDWKDERPINQLCGDIAQPNYSPHKSVSFFSFSLSLSLIHSFFLLLLLLFFFLKYDSEAHKITSVSLNWPHTRFQRNFRCVTFRVFNVGLVAIPYKWEKKDRFKTLLHSYESEKEKKQVRYLCSLFFDLQQRVPNNKFFQWI